MSRNEQAQTISRNEVCRRRSLSSDARITTHQALEERRKPYLTINYGLGAAGTGMGKGAREPVPYAQLCTPKADGTIHKFPCVAKRIASDEEVKNIKRIMALTEDSSTHITGLLQPVAIMKEYGAATPACDYAVYPVCELMLSDCQEAIAKLNNQEAENQQLFQLLVINLLEKLSTALLKLDETKLTHRDIAPKNIGIRDGHPCLLDFDYLADYDELKADNTGHRPGSPIYMAPELLALKQITHPDRIDTYALGQLLRELSGEPWLHTSSTNDLSDIPALCEAKVAAFTETGTEPPRLNTKPLAEYTTFFELFNDLTGALTHPEPQARADAKKLADALTHLKTLAPPATPDNNKKVQEFYLAQESQLEKHASSPHLKRKPSRKLSLRSPSSPHTSHSTDDPLESSLLHSSLSAGRGASGSIRRSSIVMQTQDSATHIPCVTKSVPSKIHQLVTTNSTTETSGILTPIATTDDEQVLPECELMLSDCMVSIAALKQSSDQTLHQAFIISFLERMVLGLETLAQYQVAHLDLKPENIGIYNHQFAMIDFDRSKCFQQTTTLQLSDSEKVLEGSCTGTPQYMSPEMCRQDYEQIREKPTATDLFSVGQILRKLCGEKPAYIPEGLVESIPIIFAIGTASQQRPVDLNAALAHSQASFDSITTALYDAMINISPDTRPTLAEIKVAIAKLKAFAPNHLAPEVQEKIHAFYAHIEVEQLKKPSVRISAESIPKATPQGTRNDSYFGSNATSEDSFPSTHSTAFSVDKSIPIQPVQQRADQHALKKAKSKESFSHSYPSSTHSLEPAKAPVSKSKLRFFNRAGDPASLPEPTHQANEHFLTH